MKRKSLQSGFFLILASAVQALAQTPMNGTPQGCPDEQIDSSTRLVTAIAPAAPRPFFSARPASTAVFAEPTGNNPALSVGCSLARPIQPESHLSLFAGHPAQCGPGCIGECCCGPVWGHRTGSFGEFLYLRPRDAEVVYATEFNGAVQVGPVATTDPDFSPGYRAGVVLCLDESTSIVATYSRLGSNTDHMIDVNPTNVLRSPLIHPGSTAAGSNFLTGFASHDVDFDLLDVDYRSVLNCGDLWAWNYVLGARYGRLEQDFQARFTNAGSTEALQTDIDFDGAGLRLGLDVERHACNHGLLAYAKGFVSLLAGDFRATYFEGRDSDTQVVDTSWKVGRVVPILDLEMGAGWQSPCGHFRFTGGYMFSAWFNTLTTDEWIQGVHNNQYIGLSEGLTFDGLTARAEYRF